MSKSTLPVEHGFTNSYYDRAGYLIDNGERFANIAIKIQELSRNGMSLDDIMLYVKNNLRPELRNLYDDYQDVPETPPVMAAPPRAVEVYGRFADRTKIVDIGSGNCNKLMKFTGSLNVFCVDPAFKRDNNVVKGVAENIETQTALFTDDVIFTSFMSLCQLSKSTQDLIGQYDGLHLVPDHDLLLESGVAVLDEQKIVVNAPTKFYVDERVANSGYPLKPGYLLAPYYRERDITFTFDAGPTLTNYSPVIDATPCRYSDINLDDITFKMDGIAYELEVQNGVAMLVDRAGYERIGVADCDFHFCLHVEELEHCYTLIRVVMYRGMIPPHSGRGLSDFVAKVRVRINGKELCAPPPVIAWQDGRVPVFGNAVNGRRSTYLEKTDGVITRFEEHDFYTKFQWTADLLDTNFSLLGVSLKNKGLLLSADIRRGLWEYGINRVGDTVVFSPLRERVDKTTPTSLSTVFFLLEQPTLPERFALENL